MVIPSVTRIHHLMIMVSSVRPGLGKGERRSVRGFSESHRNPITPPHNGGFPQEPHGRCGTIR